MRASPLACSRAGQRSLQVRNAGELWGWEGERAAACQPACSPARAQVTSSLRAGHKRFVLLLLHIATLLLPH